MTNPTSTHTPFKPPTQRGILSVSLDELTELLRLPEGHRVERVTITDYPFAPGIMVTVSGLAMVACPAGSPLVVEQYGCFIVGAERRVAQAKAHWARQAREYEG